MKRMKSLILKLMLLFNLAISHGQTTTPMTTSTTETETETTEMTPEIVLKSPNKHVPLYEEHATTPILMAEQRMQQIYSLERELFHSPRNSIHQIEASDKRRKIDQDIHNLVYELASNLSVIPVQHLTNHTLRRQVQRLSKLGLHGLHPHDYEIAKRLLRAMESFVTTPMVPICQNDDCNKLWPMVPDMISKIKTFKKGSDLDHFWLKWRVELDKLTSKSKFLEYIKLWRKIAAYNGHVTPSRSWYLNYDTENFQRELEDVVMEIMPLYQELHAYLRHTARKHYGDRITNEKYAIPAPIMEQMLLQDWSPNTVFRPPYPKHHLPNVQNRLQEMLQVPKTVFTRALSFFVNDMGIDPLPEDFLNSSYFRKIFEDDFKGECKNQLYYFPPKIGIRYCPKVHYKGLIQTHGKCMELLYNEYRKKMPYGLDIDPCPGFMDALAEAAVIASGTPRHLYRLTIYANDSLAHEQSLNRLFRMGVHTLLAIPQYFINDKYLVEVMDRHIEPQNFNCAYWRLQNKYAGIVAPIRRSEKNFDPDWKFYKGLNPKSPNTVKFISEVLGFQFYRSFCLDSEEYKPGKPDFPLYNCDFLRSKKVGEKIHKMMKMGATRHWRDVMEVATNERRLSGKGIMEYFAPLYIWLKEKNRELGVLPGWDDDIKCGNAF